MKISKLLVMAMLMTAVYMAVPAMGATITVYKEVVPATPNVYKPGDTIHYDMYIQNPHGTADLRVDDVYDTFPDGTVVHLDSLVNIAWPDFSYPLAAGAIQDYDLDWTVPLDMEPGIVVNRLDAEGLQLTTPLPDAAGGFALKSSLIVGARISITPTDTNPVGTPHNFTVTVEQNEGLGSGWVAASDVLVTGTTDFGTITSAPALTNPSGQMTITVNSALPGTATVHASGTVTILGLPIDVATDGYGAFIVENEKTWVDAYITIEPDGTNPINADHTFTATVFQDDGLTAGEGGDGVTGWTPVDAGVPVTITLTNGGGAVANPAGPFNLNTNASGQVSVTFTSATPGTVTGHASTTFSVGGESLTRETDGIAPNSDDAVKTFVEGCLTITKSVVLENVSDPTALDGTFTIHVTGPSGYVADVDFTLTDGAITSTNPVTLLNLVPGIYTLTEPTLPAGWSNTSGLGDVVVEADQACASVTVVNTFREGGDAFCSFTQGFYGNEGGKACGGLTTTQIINEVIGTGVVVGIEGERSILFDSAACIILRLPAGGKASALPEGLGDADCDDLPTSLVKKNKPEINNVLVGQVVALTLNLRLHTIPCLGGDTVDESDDDGDLGAYTFDLLAEYICVQEGEDGCIERYMVPEALRGLSANDILLAANMALAGEELDIGAINDAATFINELFDECRTIVTCPELDSCDYCDPILDCVVY